MRQNSRQRFTYENFTVTLECDRNVWIDGCLAILVYERDRVVLRLSRRHLTVNGCDLFLKSYSSHELCISGKITSVILEEGR